VSVFDRVDLAQVAVRDNGTLRVQAGSLVQKKFKYFNNEGVEPLDIEVASSIPSLIQIKTEALSIAPGQFELIKFMVAAPLTPVIIDAKILITNARTRKEEEIIEFKIDVDK